MLAVEVGIGIEVAAPHEHLHPLLEVIDLLRPKELLNMPPANRREPSLMTSTAVPHVVGVVVSAISVAFRADGVETQMPDGILQGLPITGNGPEQPMPDILFNGQVPEAVEEVRG